MKHKAIIIAVFVIMALAQLFVPAQMIMERENVLSTGSEFKFRTAPVDPYDPFRGKYITLNYSIDKFYTSDSTWRDQAKAYVLIETDADGFARIDDVVREEPTDKENYIYCDVHFNAWQNPHYLSVEFPFDRFYMDEYKAKEAEISYRNLANDTAVATYALVSVKAGDAVIKDVFIGDTPIKDYVIEQWVD
jgi:uncharacterized membrane-anchored protein